MVTAASGSLITVTAKPTWQFSPGPDSRARQLRHEPRHLRREPGLHTRGFKLRLLPAVRGGLGAGQTKPRWASPPAAAGTVSAREILFDLAHAGEPVS
jgi:hypothetical protein